MVMADDGDRDRGRRRRRRGGGRKEYDREYIMPAVVPSKPPIILAKPPGEKKIYSDLLDGPAEHTLVNKLPPDKPPILLKPRADENHRHQTLNGSVPNIPGLMAGEGGTPHAYTMQRPPSVRTGGGPLAVHGMDGGSSQTRLAPPPEMIRSIKLVDDTLTWCESGMEMLLDQTDFLVIGVLGMQGVGKSTLLSHLTGSHKVESSRLVFRHQSLDSKELSGHQTFGIDMYVNSERIIFLDTQPLMSASLLYHIIQHDKKFPTDYTSTENCVEMQSLQVASFLMTVCNVVLVVADWFLDTSLLRCIRVAEMLKPATPGHDTSVTKDYNPHVVTVLNRAEREDFSAENYMAMQTALERVMNKTKLKYRSGVTMADVSDMPQLTKRSVQKDISLFLVPDQNNKSNAGGMLSLLPSYQGHPGFDSVISSLKKQLYAIPRHPLTHTTLSEKNWFHYAARTWDGIKKSQMFAEYNRLLP